MGLNVRFQAIPRRPSVVASIDQSNFQLPEEVQMAAKEPGKGKKVAGPQALHAAPGTGAGKKN